MVDERVFHVEGNKASPAKSISLAEAGFLERQNLQEWVLEHPEIMGDDVKVITSEFNGWQDAIGGSVLNRLDVLGIDSEGRLVLAELKRDRANDSIQLQAINYAALASRLTVEQLVDLYHRQRSAKSPEISLDTAKNELFDHCGGEIDPEVLNPRIVLIAGDFNRVTTTAVDWLTEQGLDITLQRLQAYKLKTSEIVVTVSQLYPLAVVDDLLVSPRQTAFQAKQEKSRTRRETSTVIRLINENILEDGTELTLSLTTAVTAEVRQKIEELLAKDPSKGKATWYNKRNAPLLWEHDGEAYKPTTIVKKIILEATGKERSVAGPQWWRNEKGISLPELLDGEEATGFEWDSLHKVLENLPAGRWASYGDLAALIGTAAQPLGSHLSKCDECESAWRVLDSKGRSSSAFTWNGSDRTETQQEVLEKEGVRFTPDGYADPAQRLSAEELATLLETENI